MREKYKNLLRGENYPPSWGCRTITGAVYTGRKNGDNVEENPFTANR